MADSKPLSTRSLIFRRTRLAIVGFGIFYVFAVVLIMIPQIQTSVLYASHIHFFGYNKFDHPQDYGLAPGKTVNMKLRSSDNTTIGAWFMFSDPFYRKLGYPLPASPTRYIPTALKNGPTILFLHGNTGTRALPVRITVYTGLTARLGANVFAIDYRGFGDSEGHPSVKGVARDARAGWDYLMSQGANPEDVLIVGHSLGTAIAGMLAAELGRDGIHPRGLVLMSPFSSVRSLIDHYNLFGFLPLLKPLSLIPLAPRLLTWSLVHNFDTLTLVPEMKLPVLIVHAENDWDIPHSHSSLIFDAFTNPQLPPASHMPENPMSTSEWEKYAEQKATYEAHRKEVVSTVSIPGFGVLEQIDSRGRTVAMLKTLKGGHDIGRMEGVQDAIGKMFAFF